MDDILRALQQDISGVVSAKVEALLDPTGASPTAKPPSFYRKTDFYDRLVSNGFYSSFDGRGGYAVVVPNPVHTSRGCDRALVVSWEEEIAGVLCTIRVAGVADGQGPTQGFLEKSDGERKAEDYLEAIRIGLSPLNLDLVGPWNLRQETRSISRSDGTVSPPNVLLDHGFYRLLDPSTPGQQQPTTFELFKMLQTRLITALQGALAPGQSTLAGCVTIQPTIEPGATLALPFSFGDSRLFFYGDFFPNSGSFPCPYISTPKQGTLALVNAIQNKAFEKRYTSGPRIRKQSPIKESPMEELASVLHDERITGSSPYDLTCSYFILPPGVTIIMASDGLVIPVGKTLDDLLDSIADASREAEPERAIAHALTKRFGAQDDRAAAVISTNVG